MAPATVAVQEVPVISRYVLVGVVAGLRRTGGAALIAVDGGEAKPVRVGNLIDEGKLLQSVTGRRAVLASTTGGRENFTLELPALSN